MDPVLTFILQIAIVVALVYFYFWIRSLSRRVDQADLNARLEELEQSVTDTTRWLETASDQIRRDLDRRMAQLKDLMDSAENSTDRSATDTPEVLSDPDRSMAGAPMEQAVLGGSVAEFTGEDANDGRRAGSGAAIEQAAETPIETSETVAGRLVRPEAESDGAPSGQTTAAGGDSGSPGSGIDTRRVILELAGQGISIPEIAKRVNSSRSEVELVVAFQKSH